jgi:putative flippase GtrA
MRVKIKRILKRMIKYAIVGGTGVPIQLGLTYLLTEKFHIWYIFSMCCTIGVTFIWNFTMNSLWTFKRGNNEQ